MKDYEDEAFDELEKKLQKQVATGVTDGNKKDAALRLALEALKNTTPTGFNMESDKKFFAAIKAIEEALEDV